MFARCPANTLGVSQGFRKASRNVRKTVLPIRRKAVCRLWMFASGCMANPQKEKRVDSSAGCERQLSFSRALKNGFGVGQAECFPRLRYGLSEGVTVRP